MYLNPQKVRKVVDSHDGNCEDGTVDRITRLAFAFGGKRFPYATLAAHSLRAKRRFLMSEISDMAALAAILALFHAPIWYLIKVGTDEHKEFRADIKHLLEVTSANSEAIKFMLQRAKEDSNGRLSARPAD